MKQRSTVATTESKTPLLTNRRNRHASDTSLVTTIFTSLGEALTFTQCTSSILVLRMSINFMNHFCFFFAGCGDFSVML